MEKRFIACKANTILQQQDLGFSTPEHLHSDVILRPDHTGVYVPYDANEPVYTGANAARAVPNFNGDDAAYSIQLNSIIPVDGTYIIKINLPDKTVIDDTGDNIIFQTSPNDNSGFCIYHSDEDQFMIFFNYDGGHVNIVDYNSKASESSEIKVEISTVSGTTRYIICSTDGVVFYYGELEVADHTMNPTIGSNVYQSSAFLIGQVLSVQINDLLIPLDEGQGTDIHDIDGNIVGTVTANNIDDFWSGRIRHEGITKVRTVGLFERTSRIVLGQNYSLNTIRIKLKFICFDLTSLEGDHTQIFSIQNSSAPWTPILLTINDPGTTSPNIVRGLLNQDDETSLSVYGPEIEVGKEYIVEFYAENGAFGLIVNGTLYGNYAYDGTIYPHVGEYGISLSPRFFDGKIWDVELNGVKYPLNEGQGTDIHNHLGHAVGTVISNDLNTFWSGKVYTDGIKRRSIPGFDSRTAAPYMHIDLSNMYDPAVTYIDIECYFICRETTNWVQQPVRLAVNESPWRVVSIVILTGGTIQATFPIDGVTQFLDGPVVELGKIYHVKFLAENDLATLTVNGVEYTMTYSGSFQQNGSGQVFLSNPADNQNFIGSVWNFRIFDKFVPCDEGFGTNIHDYNGDVVGSFENLFENYKVAWGNSVAIDTPKPVYGIDWDGNPLTPVLHYQSEFTNEMYYSRNLATWSDAGTGTMLKEYNQIGITGEPNTATYLEDQSTESQKYVYKGIDGGVVDNEGFITVIYIRKKDTDPGYVPNLKCVFYGGTTFYSSFKIDLVTGDFILSGSIIDGLVESAGDWWKVVFEAVNNATGNTTGQVQIIPSDSPDINSPSDPALMGDCVIGYVGAFRGTTIDQVKDLGPIFTEDSTVTVARTNYAFNNMNVDNRSMALTATVSASEGKIITDFLRKVGTDLQLSDKGNNALTHPSQGIDNVGIVVSPVSGTENRMWFYVNGNELEGAYTGQLVNELTEPIEIGRDNQGVIELSDFEVVKDGTFEELKQSVRDKYNGGAK